MYKCQQCEGEAKVIEVQDIDQYENPCISKLVACEECGYEIPKVMADKEILLDACKFVFPLAEGERINFDIIEPKNDVEKSLKLLWNQAVKKLRDAIEEAEK